MCDTKIIDNAFASNYLFDYYKVFPAFLFLQHYMFCWFANYHKEFHTKPGMFFLSLKKYSIAKNFYYQYMQPKYKKILNN